MPKLYKEGEIVPSETNEYYKLKMREYRARKGSDKQVYWTLVIDDKTYVFKRKSDMNISKINKDNIDSNKHIICF